MTPLRTIDDVGRWLDDVYAKTPPGALRHEVLVDPEDLGVPADMQDGSVDEEGYVRWKILPGTLGESALAHVVARTGELPRALVGWLVARHHLFQEATTGRRHRVMLPPTPTHAPLREFEATLDGWARLLEAGWLAFGDFDVGAGPLCLDLRARSPLGDAPVVWFDHEAILSLDEALWGDRGALAPLARPLYASLEELLSDMFP